MEVNIYIGLDLEDEVHSIWVIWTSDLHSWGRTIAVKDKTLDWAAWAVTRNISEGRECGGAHQRLLHRTELVGVSLASGVVDLRC